jgi:hypothetical protein
MEDLEVRYKKCIIYLIKLFQQKVKYYKYYLNK